MAGTPDDKLARLAEQFDGYITTGHARAAGLTERQIRYRADEKWRRVYDGVFRMPGAPVSWTGELRAACWAAGPGAFVSHRAAATFYEAPGRRSDLIEITCPRWERSTRTGLVVHETRRPFSSDITEINGLPIVTPELLVLQLAWWKPYPNYVEAVIHALRRKRLISYSSTHATFLRHARRGLRGVAATRIALERWNPANAPTASKMETLLVQTFRAHDLPEPVLQYEVCDANGLFVARTDAGLPQWKIVVEYQSMQEHLDEFQAAADDRRRNKIMGAGYWPLVARIGDLRSGGYELVEEILAVRNLRVANAELA
jgi:hypothetical protein